jgi:hypothetical protein
MISAMLDWLTALFLGFLAVAFVWWLAHWVVTAERPTFSLQKDEWQCTQTAEEEYRTIAGKVPITRTRTVCIQWSRG